MLQIIGSYDRRTMIGTIAAPDAHAMVKANAPKVSKPRAPKSRTIEEIQKRCKEMGVKFESQGKEIYLTPSSSSEYYSTSQKHAWQVLDRIASDILATLSDDQVFEQSTKAKALIF